MTQWTTFAVLKGHSQSVSAVALLRIPNSRDFLLVSGGSEGFLQSWRIGGEEPGASLLARAKPGTAASRADARKPSCAELLQRIDLTGKIPLELSLCLLPDSTSA